MTPLPTSLALPFSLALLAIAGQVLVHRVFGRADGLLDRCARAALYSVALPILLVALLGWASVLTPIVLLGATLLSSAVVIVVSGARARRAALCDGRLFASVLRGAFLGGTWSSMAWIGAIATAVAAIAVMLLPPWAWDALGYHLPLVHDALLSQRLREVPTHIPYVNAYPHVVDLYFVWWRALLADDTWIELAQLPFAALGVVSGAALARRAGVRDGRAVAWSVLFLAVPAVALQLATNYVDVAYAGFLVAAVHLVTLRPTARALATQIGGGIALGLFLGTKPSAPVPYALVVLGVLISSRDLRAMFAVVATSLLVGARSYVGNLVAHGNPVWPVRMKLGPIELPGLESAGYFFNLGVPEHVKSYGWLGRLLSSWFAWPARFIYDMRIGGLGPVLWILLLLTAWALVRERRALRPVAAPVILLALASLASPAAFWARYTLGIIAALLVVAARGTERWSRASRGIAEVSLAAAGALGLVVALPGFTDHGVSLASLFSRASVDRAATFGGIDGREADWIAARARVRPGEAIAYDRGFGLPGQLWDGNGSARIVYLREGDPIAETLVRERVAVAALSESGAAAAARDGVRLELLFACPLDPCSVYSVTELSAAR